RQVGGVGGAEGRLGGHEAPVARPRREAAVGSLKPGDVIGADGPDDDDAAVAEGVDVHALKSRTAAGQRVCPRSLTTLRALADGDVVQTASAGVDLARPGDLLLGVV